MTNYNSKDLIKDVLAGLTTAFSAIALGAAFGVQSGRGAFAGMISAGLIALITSLLGGTRIQASGPTGPMTTIFGIILTFATAESSGIPIQDTQAFISMTVVMAGIIMVLLGLLRFGKLITFVPTVVLLGFMNGIAILIWLDQIKKLFGLDGAKLIGGDIIQNTILAIITFLLIYFMPRLIKKLPFSDQVKNLIPGTLLSIVVMTIIFKISQLNLETVKVDSSFNLETIQSFFPGLNVWMNTGYLLKALPLALQLAMLGYLDSLLTSLVIDKLTGETTKKNKELVAQGIANGVVGLIGGIPGAQATIRSVILVKEGAKTRLAGVLVGIFTLVGTFAFGPLIALVASAIFVGALFKAGLDVFEKDYLNDYISKKWYTNTTKNWQFIFVVYTTLVTVVFDLNIAVISGTILFFIARKYLNVEDLTDEEEQTVAYED